MRAERGQNHCWKIYFCTSSVELSCAIARLFESIIAGTFDCFELSFGSGWRSDLLSSSLFIWYLANDLYNDFRAFAFFSKDHHLKYFFYSSSYHLVLVQPFSTAYWQYPIHVERLGLLSRDCFSSASLITFSIRLDRLFLQRRSRTWIKGIWICFRGSSDFSLSLAVFKMLDLLALKTSNFSFHEDTIL